ncbi:MAG: hypothetical protein HW416_3930, partial [Chloroflexi bacterium]|nr:hypothetical protein [Chloroflexota bacterium]
SEIGWFEWNVFEAEQWTRFSLVARQDFGVQLERWQRDPPPHAPMHLQEFEVHVDRISQLGLAFLQRTKLESFA